MGGVVNFNGEQLAGACSGFRGFLFRTLVLDTPVRFEGGKIMNHKKRPSFVMAFVGMARFELATSSSRTKRATGLRYIPFVFVWACKSNIFSFVLKKKFDLLEWIDKDLPEHSYFKNKCKYSFWQVVPFSFSSCCAKCVSVVFIAFTPVSLYQ